ncbi:hypothetical protein CAL7716_074620 [Calothrix sp. PCC 7716]|nr:hypothetical protein CAL7716_074620 [Calothrix sp. PCC 7716]
MVLKKSEPVINQQLARIQCFATKATQDMFATLPVIDEPQKHLSAAVSWLKRAHDISLDDGVSWGYSLKGGWRTSYRETSGYIAVTFFNLAQQLNDNDSWDRAVKIAKWLCDIQNSDGSVSNTRYSSEGIVFDTGQVLLGYIRAYQETQEPCFLQAAERASDWLVRVADSSGRWTRNTHLGIPHVYNTRVAWALLELNALKSKPEYLQVAYANLDWGLSQQKNGWFDQCAFTADAAPFTHNIVYALRGLFESGIIQKEQKYIDAAVLGSQAMLAKMHSNGFIPGQIDSSGKSDESYCCLTGNCQMAILWLKLFELKGDKRYYQAALTSLQYVMSCQDIQTSDLNIRGGIKGSQPIWGKYTRLSYPNWATKFFIDGLLMLIKTNV